MINNQPLFSIIVPVFRVENFIERCIKSIIEQTFNNFELLLIDDGSPDKSGELCDLYAQKDKRITVTHTKNGGVSKARNIGIEQAKGEYLLFVDADDTLYDNITLEYLAQNVLSLKADIYQYNTAEKKDNIITQHKFYHSTQIDNIKTYAKKKYTKGNVWSYIFSKHILTQYHIRFPEGVRISEDQAFTYSVLTYCDNIALLSRPCYIYNLDENPNNSGSRKNYSEDIKHHLNATAYIANHLQQCNKNRTFTSERIAMMILYISNLAQHLSYKEIKSFNVLFKNIVPFNLGYLRNNKWAFVIAAYFDLRLEAWLYRLYTKRSYNKQI